MTNVESIGQVSASDGGAISMAPAVLRAADVQNASVIGEASTQPSEQLQVNKNSAVESSEKKSKTPRTRGWWAFDIMSYLGVGFLGNVAVSTFIGRDQVKREFKKPTTLPEGFHKINDVIDRFFTKWATKAYEHVLPKSKILTLPTRAEAKSMGKLTGGITAAVLLLSWGGTAIFFLIKPLENMKPKLVRTFDNGIDKVRSWFGKKPDEQELNDRKDIYNYLDSKQARESTAKLFVGRYFSVAVLIVTIMAMVFVDPTRKALGHLETVFFKVTDKIGAWRGKKFSWADESNPYTKKLTGLLVIEVFGSGFTAAAAYLKIKLRELMGKRKDQHEEHETQEFAERYQSLKQKGVDVERWVNENIPDDTTKKWTNSVPVAPKSRGESRSELRGGVAPSGSHVQAVSNTASQNMEFAGVGGL